MNQKAKIYQALKPIVSYLKVPGKRHTVRLMGMGFTVIVLAFFTAVWPASAQALTQGTQRVPEFEGKIQDLNKKSGCLDVRAPKEGYRVRLWPCDKADEWVVIPWGATTENAAKIELKGHALCLGVVKRAYAGLKPCQGPQGLTTILSISRFNVLWQFKRGNLILESYGPKTWLRWPRGEFQENFDNPYRTFVVPVNAE